MEDILFLNNEFFTETHDVVVEFVEDLFRYILEFMDTDQPPHVSFRSSTFTNNIGKALLKAKRNTNDLEFVNDVQQFISECLLIPSMEEIRIKIFVFMCDDIGSEDTIHHESYFDIFLKACKLCEGFLEAQRTDYIQITKETLKDVLRELEIDFDDFCDVDEFAAQVVDSLTNR